MRAFKDSGIEWLGEIPEHWEILRNKTYLLPTDEKVGNRKDITLLSLTKQGVIVRHLILPLHTQESKQVLDYLKQNYDKQILVSVMSQFTPFGECDRFPEINRKLTSREIKSVNNHFLELDLDGFIQNSKSADTCFIPNWNK